jgi:hypothetical protein
VMARSTVSVVLVGLKYIRVIFFMPDISVSCPIDNISRFLFRHCLFLIHCGLNI